MGTNYRMVLLMFIGSLTLADHIGDVSNDIHQVLKDHFPDIQEEWDTCEGVDPMNELGNILGRMGITTLLGTSLKDDDAS